MCVLASLCSALGLVDYGQMVTAAEATSIEWEPGLHAIYEGRAAYPRVVELADGTLLATFDHRTTTGRAIGCTRSIDGGKTWGQYKQVCEDTGRSDLANAFPLQLPDGTILVACRHHTLAARRYRLEVYASEDQGKHWSLRSTLAEGTEGLWEPFLLQLPNGKLQGYYASEEGCHPEQTIEMRTSIDGGKIWADAVTVARKKGSRDGMPAAALLPTGEILVVFEAQDLPPFRFVLRAVRSMNGGKSWSKERELVYRPTNPARSRWSAGAPSVITTSAGRLLVAFQTDDRVTYEQRSSERDPASPIYNYPRHASFAYLASDDNGKTWNGPSYLLGGPRHSACWNAFCPLHSGRVLALTTHEGRVWCRIGRPQRPNS